MKRQLPMTGWATLAAIGTAAALALVPGAHAQGSPELPASRIPDLSQVFVLLFVMLGPIKIIGPFAAMMQDAEEKSCRKLAVHAFAIASATTLIAAAVGRAILENWHVSLGALLIAGGVILFLVALRQVLQQYAPAPEAEVRPQSAAFGAMAVRLAFPTIVTPYGIATVIILFLVALRQVLQQYAPEAEVRPQSAAFGAMAVRLAFPTIVTPYGIATVIILLSVSPDMRYVVGVAAALIGVMVLNLLAMLYARKILKAVGLMPLQIVGTVLMVMQVALGVQMILGGLRMIGVLAQS